jgi:hypothetical protein
MNNATAVNAGYGGLVHRWLFVLLAIMMSFMVTSPAMARRINGGLVGGTLVPPFEAPTPGIPPQFDITGFVESATVDPTMCPAVTDPRLKGGTARMNGQTITIPCNTILQMPAFALTWADLWTMAPKDIMPAASTASGLALGDIMATGALGLLNTPWTDANTGLATSYNAALPSHEFHIQGNVINGQYIAGLIFISQQGLNAGQGVISCIDYATGEMQVGGTVLPHGTTPCPTPAQLAASGQKVTRVRMNDPVGRYGIVHGGPGSVGADVIEAGYDPRYTADTDNPTMHSALGYPVCVPAFNPVNAVTDPVTGVVIPAAIDAKCPLYNRPIAPNCKSYDPLTLLPAFGGQPAGYCTTWLMDAPGAHALDATLTDPTLNAPLVIGDTIIFHGTMKADAKGPYISAHSIEANLGIYTQPHTMPAYTFIESMGVGTGGGTIGGAATESTLKVFWTGFSTDPTELVDFYAIHQDPATGVATDYFLGTFDPCCVPLGRFRSPVNNVGVFGEPQRNYRAVSRTACQKPGINGPLTPQLQTRCYMDPPATPETIGTSALMAAITPQGNGLIPGQFTLPNFGFIFGENLAFGGPIIPANFQDIPFLFCGSGPIGGPGTATSVVGQLDPAPWGLPQADPVFHSTLCPAALAVGAVAVVAGPPAPLPPVINSVTATPASTLVGKLTTVTLTVAATNPQGTPMSFAWTPPAGIIMSCGVCAPNAANATVTATFNPTKAGSLVFAVTVSNGVLPNATGSATVLVASATAKAPTLKSFGGTPATVNGGAGITLTAIANTNPTGGAVTFSFTQTGGAPVIVNGVVVPLGQPIAPTTTSGVAPADQTAKVTVSAPFVPVAANLTFQVTVTDTTTGLTTSSSATAVTIKVNATPPDVLIITTATYRPIVSRFGAPAQLGKFNMTVTSTATPPPVGMTVTASIVNNTLPANVPGSTALPILMPLLYTPADVPGTLTPNCGATPCWSGLVDGIIQDPTQTPTGLLVPSLVTVTSSLGGVATTFPGDAIFKVR